MENLSTVIICVIIAAVCVYALVSYRKKLKNGCCGSGGGEVKIKAENTDKSHYTYKSVVYIDGMTCNHCKTRVENAFNSHSCLAKVNLRRKYAEVWSEKELSEEELRKIVEKSDYTFLSSKTEKLK